MEQVFVSNVLPKLRLRHLFNMRRPPLWFSFDREGDVLHVVFDEAKKQDKSVLGKDDIIVTKRDSKIINMTILNASRFVR